MDARSVANVQIFFLEHFFINDEDEPMQFQNHGILSAKKEETKPTNRQTETTMLWNIFCFHFYYTPIISSIFLVIP